MDDFKSRLRLEQMQLEDKLIKLDTFIKSDKFNNVDPTQAILLRVQSGIMHTYNQCLLSRLELLEK